MKGLVHGSRPWNGFTSFDVGVEEGAGECQEDGRCVREEKDDG